MYIRPWWTQSSSSSSSDEDDDDNKALCGMGKKSEENFLRDLIVSEILALCGKLCLRCPQRGADPHSYCLKSHGSNLPRTFVIITYGGN